jgi:predicted nucleotidyltransferase
MVDRTQLSAAVVRLRKAAQPERIILFGSHAGGDAGVDSDLDLLVVEREVPDRAREMVRLRRVLGPLGVPVDLIVVSEETFEYWSDTPGTLFFEAATEGKVLYEKAA